MQPSRPACSDGIPTVAFLSFSTQRKIFFQICIETSAWHLVMRAILPGTFEKYESGVISYARRRGAGRRISSSAIEGTLNRRIGGRLGEGRQYAGQSAEHICS